MSYYNTTNLAGIKLRIEQKQTEKQEDIILRIFKSNSKLNPFDVQRLTSILGYNYPITSIRRAITDLTDDEKLRKTDEMREGGYGKLNYLWEAI